MLNSVWQINKVGLIDFWFYDEEEFSFRDGRMLLRGANGSGKSVTMQSFIPLLMDGNMRPERIDPFGSKERKMSNYLLDEEDTREERTGYLYMELKRRKTDTYITFGIGMRARKNKKLDTWYFYISDNRRIGKNFSLFRDEKSRMTCTRTELKNRIGEGGCLFDSQREYESCVNQQLFGYRTEGEYEELLNLLIQLRTPKLSKEFKPTVINEILSNSLQTLSDEDLRPMSEAIENMDGIQTNLENLKESIKAGEQIGRVYRQYNEEMLVSKAGWYEKALLEVKENENQISANLAETEELKREIEASRKRYDLLEEEYTLCEKEKRSLDQSDAARLKETEQALLREMEQCQIELKKKEKQLDIKTEAERTYQNRKKKEEEAAELCRDQILKTLSDMEEVLEAIPFDDGVFFLSELKEGMDQEFAFKLHQTELRKYHDLVKDGRKRISRMEEASKEMNRVEMRLDESRKQRTIAEKERKQYDEQLSEIKSELIEEVSGWNQNNQELQLGEETLRTISHLIDQYFHGCTYHSIAAEIDPFWKEADKALADFSYLCERRVLETREEVHRISQEISDWENKKEPEPERSEAVLRNREHLAAKGIPFTPFYQTVDFAEGLSEAQINHLEEALLHMGVLDALVIPSEYRDEVMKQNPDTADRYLFGDAAAVKPGLTELLDVDNTECDILFYQRIYGILSGMGWNPDGNPDHESSSASAFIRPDGSWHMGVLDGTITGTREACFIGSKARERFRRRKIEELKEIFLKEKERLAALEAEWEGVKNRQKRLLEEYRAFPKGEDLEVAARMLYEKDLAYKECDRRVRGLEEQYQEAYEEYKEKSLLVQEACRKCRLAARADVFDEADNALEEYKELLTDVITAHARYLAALSSLAAIEETLESILDDLDEIRYEIGTLEKREREKSGEHAAVLKQLAMTGYEEIRERLDHCIRRIKEIPGEKEQAAGKIAGNQEKRKQREENLLQLEKEQQQISEYAEYCKQQFIREYSLFYVYAQDSLSVYEGKEIPWKKVAESCIAAFGKNGKDQKLALQEKLQELFHANRAQLAEYRPSIRYLFSQSYEGMNTRIKGLTPGRLEIICDYRGKAIGFEALLAALKTESESLTKLLDDKDRELFEDILANTISKKIRSRISLSKRWVERMNALMESMDTSSGLSLSLRWKNKPAASEEELGTRELVDLLSKDVEIMREEDIKRLSEHFRSRIRSARRLSEEKGNMLSFHTVMKEILDYRKWFEFRIEYQKTGEKKKELTDRSFFTFSGGEKAMCMYVPLFSAVAAKYDSARSDAPRLLSLDEAFAGVDERNIKDMFRLMVKFDFNFIINSQVLWADYETVPEIMIYQLIRPQNARFVTVIPYIWNGKTRSLAVDEERKEQE